MMPRCVAVVLAVAALWSVAHSAYDVRSVQLPNDLCPFTLVYNHTYDRLYTYSWRRDLIASVGVTRAALDTVVTVDGVVKGLWVDETRDLLYCVSGTNYNSFLSVFDCATNRLLNCIRTDWSPGGIDGDTVTGRVFVGFRGNEWVKAYSPMAESVVGWTLTDEYIAYVQYNGAVNKLYCKVVGWDATVLVDCSTFTCRGLMAREVGDLASYISPYNAKMYRGESFFYVIDPHTDSVRFMYDTLGAWDCFVHNPKHNLVFAGCPHERVVKILDGTADSIVGEFRPPTGSSDCMYSMAFDTTRNVLLLTSTYEDGVYVYSGTGDSLLELVPLPPRPYRVICLPDGTFCVPDALLLQIHIARPVSGAAEPGDSRAIGRAPAALLVASRRDVALSEPSALYDMTSRRVLSSDGKLLRLVGLRPGVYEVRGLLTNERRRMVILPD